MSRPELRIPYLVTGYSRPGNREEPFAGIEPAADLFFIRYTAKFGPAFYCTDALGRIRTLDRSLIGNPATALFAGKPLRITLLPRGMVQRAFMTQGGNWQKVLLDGIAAQDQPGVETVPISFGSRHLRVPGDFEGEEAAAYSILKAGGPYRGHLIPRIRILSLALPENLFEAGSARSRAGLLIGPGRKAEIHSVIPVAENAENPRIPPGFALFDIVSPEGLIEEGAYTFTIAGADLDRTRFPESHTLRKTGIRFGFRACFSIRSLLADADLHVLQPMTLEQTVTAAFPGEYAHLALPLRELPDPAAMAEESSGNPENAHGPSPDALRSIRIAGAWLIEKRKLATGGMRPEASGFWTAFVKAGWKAFARAAAEDTGEFGACVKRIDAVWDAYWTGRKIAGKWKAVWQRLEAIDHHRAGLETIARAWDGSLIERLYHATRWRKYAIGIAANAAAENRPLPALAAGLLQAGTSPEAARRLMRDGVPRELRNLDLLFGKGADAAGKGLAVLNGAVTVWTVYGTLKEITDRTAGYAESRRRLERAFAAYGRESPRRFDREALLALEGRRLLCDAARADLDAAEREAILNAVEWSLGVASFFPVVGEFASLILLAESGADLLGGLAASLGASLDAYYCGHYFGRRLSQAARIDALTRQHALNAGMLARLIRGRRPEELSADAEVQYRLRLAALIGLLRLVQRCGPRSGGKAFLRKVREYDIEGYLKAFLLEPPEGSLPNRPEIPMDMLWLYAKTWRPQGGREPRVSEDALLIAAAGPAAGRIPLGYPALFPIHAMDSVDAGRLALLFSTDHSGAAGPGSVDAFLWLRKSPGSVWIRWVDWRGPILPHTGVRVVLQVRGRGDLRGLPVSLQLIRDDLRFDNEGPLYKGILADMDVVLAGFSAERASPSEGRTAGCEFIPFYFLRDAFSEGLKPFGPLGLRRNLEYRIRFRARIGDFPYPVNLRLGPARTPSAVTVSMPLEDSACAEMLLRPEFLRSRTTSPAYEALFPGFPASSRPALLCAFARQTDGWKASVAESALGGLCRTQTLDLRAGFRWDAPLEMVFLLGAGNCTRFLADHWEKKIPAKLAMAETTGRDRRGPSYGIEFAPLYGGSAAGAGILETADLAKELARLNLIADAGGFPAGGLSLSGPRFLFAARFTPAYQVEDAAGKLRVFEGLKPFSRRMIREGSGHWTFAMSIESDPPTLGIRLDACLELAAGGVPRLPPFDRPFLGDERFVTGESVAPSLRIERADYADP